MEFRLEASFAGDAVFGGPRAKAFFESLGELTVAFGSREGWLDDPAQFDIVRGFLIRHLRAMQLVAPSDHQLNLLDTALNSFVSTQNPIWLEAARAILADPQFPSDKKEAARAAIAEAETEQSRRARFRAAIPPDEHEPTAQAGGEAVVKSSGSKRASTAREKRK
jgi:hypothetical protein